MGACRDRFEQVLDRLEARAPCDGFWLGPSPSRADVALFAQLWSLRTEMTPDYAERLALRAKLTAWLSRIDDACARAATPQPAATRSASRRWARSPRAAAFG
jgi:glutathione S-transferase